MSRIIPKELLAQVPRELRQQVLSFDQQLAQIEKMKARRRKCAVNLSGGKPLGTDDVTKWLRTLWPKQFQAELAPFHTELLEWLFARDPAQSSSRAFIWPRGFAKTTLGRVMPIALATRGYSYVLYVQATQVMANSSVQSIGDLLSHPAVAQHYPLLGQPQVSETGQQNAWRQSRLHTASGLIIDAAGLNTAVRGLNLNGQRPDVIIFDDIDAKNDSLESTEKKLETMLSSIIPAGSANRCVVILQNIINEHGIVTRLAGLDAEHPRDFLMDCGISGPYKAVEGLEYELLDVENPQPGAAPRRYVITAGTPTWPSVRPLSVLEDEMNQITPGRFISELQNEVVGSSGSIYQGHDLTGVPLPPLEEFEDIQLWCDIAVTSGKNSDSQAISVAGRHSSGIIYTMHAWEGVEDPAKFMRRAVQAAVRFQCRILGVEVNQGGDLWRDLFNRTVDDLTREGLIDSAPQYDSASATSRTGGKEARWQSVKALRETGQVQDGIGTHEVRFRSLLRIPEHKPYDLADADYWSIDKLRKKSPVRVGVAMPRTGWR